MNSNKKVIIVSPDREGYGSEEISKLQKTEKWLLGDLVKNNVLLVSSDKFKEHVAWLMYSNQLKYISPQNSLLDLEDDLGITSSANSFDKLFAPSMSTTMVFCESKHSGKLIDYCESQKFHLILIPQ